MSGPGDINIVIAQAHVVSKMHNLLKQSMQTRKQTADQIEAQRRREKKSQVESTDAENRIETEDGSFGKERRPAGPGQETESGQDRGAESPIGPGADRTHLDIKV
jgi:hypothetical protein